jgi:hypothetical protein
VLDTYGPSPRERPWLQRSRLERWNSDTYLVVEVVPYRWHRVRLSADPGCVKSRKFNLHLELPSRFRRFERTVQAPQAVARRYTKIPTSRLYDGQSKDRGEINIECQDLRSSKVFLPTWTIPR